MRDSPATTPSRPTTTRSSRPSRPPGASSSSRRRARRARRSSSRWACTSRRSSSSTTARACASSRASRQGLRHRRRHGHGKDARHPADRRRDPRHDGPARRRGQSRARGDAGDADAGTSSSSRPASRAAGSRTATSCRSDTLIVDEIHQTSAELELCLALGKRVGCRFIWLSATVDPTFYARYLDSRRRARGLRVRPGEGGAGEGGATRSRLSSSTTASCSRSCKQQRGVGDVRADARGVEEAARLRARSRRRASTPRSTTAASRSAILRPFLEGGERKPYFLAMTAAGQSALNVQGLDTVVIDDTRFTNVIERGTNVLTQAAPRRQRDPADGGARARARRGRPRVHPLATATSTSARSSPPRRSSSSPATRSASRSPAPRLGVRADELELPVPLDRIAYRERARAARGARHHRERPADALRRAVEAMPVERAWAELLVQRRRRAGAVPRGDERRSSRCTA